MGICGIIVTMKIKDPYNISGMRFFRNFPDFRKFHDLGGHSRGNRRSGLIFLGHVGGGGVTLDCDLDYFLHSLQILTHQLQLQFVCVYI